MNRKVLLYASIAVAALSLAGCTGPCSKITAINAPALRSGSADFSRYVGIGTSISAGFESGGLVDRHQIHAFPRLFASAVGSAAFTYPSISGDGIPPLLALKSLSPLVINNSGRTLGSPVNIGQATAYHDMGVPGALLFDVADSTFYYSNPFGRSATMFDIIVRHRGTILMQAMSLNPTFVTFELGANEVLGPATSGSGTVSVDVPTFAALLAGTLTGLTAALPNVKLALFNVPDVTSIPFVTTIKPYAVGPGGVHIPFLGSGGPLSESDHVLLTASDSLAVGTGVPVGAGGNGRPLADWQVLTAAEASSIQNIIVGYNSAIAGAAAARGAALVDLNGLLRQAASTGFEIGGVTYTSAFISGGLFSLDGVHPNDLAHGILANALIDAVNATYGAVVPHVDLSEAATLTSSGIRRAREEGLDPSNLRGFHSEFLALFPWKR